MIEPHGGKLVNRCVGKERLERRLEEAKEMASVELDRRESSDLELIGYGAYSPLEGFMTYGDYESVLHDKRLGSGLPWTLPITLATDEDDLREGEEIALEDDRNILGIMHIEEIYKWDKHKEALMVYGTKDIVHPGVGYVYSKKEKLLGGKIELLSIPSHGACSKYFLMPTETRKVISGKGWKRVVGFQTRNPIHRAHEYVQKCALEMADGLFIQPLVGERKKGDVAEDVMLKTYEIVVSRYYNKDRVLLCVLPASMRYAGPREAIFHAIVRKNYGCTHFIIGRDHAGVGKFYGPYDAQHIFDEFGEEELKIAPLFFDNAFYCKACGGMATEKTCPHDDSTRLVCSGTEIRERLKKGRDIPDSIMRREVVEILRRYYSDDRDGN
jgi:sulfate adenylyltransferase